MKKRLIEVCAFMLLLVACTTLVFGIAGCKPKLSTDTEVDRPVPQVNDTAQRIIDDTQPEPPDRSWVTWTECSQKPGDHPCNFSLMDQHGDMVELYDQHGKVIVIDLSTIWCGVCNNIAQEGDEWLNDYGADNFIWLTILIDNATGDPPTLADIQSWATHYNISTPVLVGDRSMVDLTAETGYPVTGWPTLVVIDQDMVLQYGINGWNESTIRGWVESLL
jgi:cytochrome oxidase Cu insertion factor (SCO1/SenC/PrrC family)